MRNGRRNATALATVAVAFVLLLAVCGASPVTPALNADPLNADPLNYVALGDSFSSGLGLGDPVSGSPVFCDRSADNFPHILAKEFALKLTDETCGGATTANVISTTLKYGKESAEPQSRALNRQTDIVTATIGGNDLGFIDVARSCVALSANGPLLFSPAQSCRSLYLNDGVDTLLGRLKTTVKSGLTAAFARIRQDAPHATVLVVGYPTIMPDIQNTPAGGCFDARFSGKSLTDLYADNIFPFTTVDTAYIHSLEIALDDVARVAAQRAGFTFISNLASTAARSSCAGADERLVNAVSIDRGADNSVVLSPGSLHPNRAGAAFLAAALGPAASRAVDAHAASTNPPSGATAPTEVWWPLWILLGALACAIVVLIIFLRRRHSG